jgi:peptide/nickel transport system permease protein
MRRNRSILAIVMTLVVLVLSADFLSPNPPEMQNLSGFYAPPAKIHFVDHEGNFHWRPFVYRSTMTDLLDATYGEIADRRYPLEFFFSGYEYRICGWIPASRHLVGLSEAGVFYPLGADELGRDVLARILAGARTSLLVIAAGILLYAALGVTIGSLAGWIGGWTDAVLMRASEFVLALPALYLLLALRAVLPLKMPYYQTAFLTVATIALVTWPPMARGVRGIILQLRNAGYIEAARSMGSAPQQIFSKHMFPALRRFVSAQAIAAAPVFLLGEVTLSFLGVGFQDSAASWGSMMRSLRDPRVITDFWWNLAPLLMVFLTLLFLQLLGGRRRANDTARF